jgi:imidazolonepropionase-like amidohydrolase
VRFARGHWRTGHTVGTPHGVARLPPRTLARGVGNTAGNGAGAFTALIDLGSATLLRGLIDSHTHLLIDIALPSEVDVKRTFNGEFEPGLLLAVAGMSPSTRVLRGAQMAREDLESGFTTVRHLGHSGIDGDVALRDAINAGRGSPAPRILAAGRSELAASTQRFHSG